MADSSPSSQASPSTAPSSKPAKPAASKVPSGFVRATVPSRYGIAYVRGPDGKESQVNGGDSVVVSIKQAKAWDASPASAPLKAEAGEAIVEDAGTAPA